jgi:hypothetical protein
LNYWKVNRQIHDKRKRAGHKKKGILCNGFAGALYTFFLFSGINLFENKYPLRPDQNKVIGFQLGIYLMALIKK